MKVFLGWSGTRSQAMALALRDWLPLVLHFVEPWLSETDIEAGQRWADAIAQELEACNFGIVCVTPENLSSPWILFEAGSLAKSLEASRVVPVLLDLDLSGIGGPLAQFQAKKIDKAGVEEAVQSINHSSSEPVPDARVKQLFDALWPELESKLEAIPAPKGVAKPARSQNQILEDLVASVRSLEAKVRENSQYGPRPPRSRRPVNIHPMMLREMAMATGAEPGDPLLLLMFASLVRDEVPWLYELALEANRAVRSGDQREVEQAIERFRRASIYLVERAPLEESGVDPGWVHYMLQELDGLLEPPRRPLEPQRRAHRRPRKDLEAE